MLFSESSTVYGFEANQAASEAGGNFIDSASNYQGEPVCAIVMNTADRCGR